MKKNILTAILALFAVTAMANKTEIDNGYRWYLQFHVNGAYSANEDMRYVSFGKALGLGGDISLGWNINDYWGVSLDVIYHNNKGVYQNSHYQAFDYKKMVYGSYCYNSVEPQLSVNYNLTNGFLGYKPNRHNAVYIHAGVGAAFTWGNDVPEPNPEFNIYNFPTPENQKVWKGNIGINYVYMFSNWVGVTADANYNIFPDEVNGAVWQVPVDSRFTIGAGLRVFISKCSNPNRITYTDDVRNYTDTIYVTKRVEIDEQDIYPIFFDTNVTDVKTPQAGIVKTIAAQLAKDPSKIVYVLGYSDKETEPANNAQLAKERADAITAELIKQGVDVERIVTHDMGDNVKPYTNLTSKNRSTICIITTLKR